MAGAAQNFAGGLRQRMNAIAGGDAPRMDPIGADESEARADSNNAHVDAPNDVSEVAPMAAVAGVDVPTDAAETTKPPRTKGRAPTSTDSASQASAPA